MPIPAFDKTFVLTLPRRADRLAEFYRLVEQTGDWPMDMPEPRYGADGSRLTVPAWCDPSIVKGSWGCTMAYAHIIEDALSRGWESVMMFEDDACFCDDFGRRVREVWDNVPDDWDAVYIGGHLRRPRRFSPQVVNDFVMRPYRMTATHGFAMRSRFMVEAYKTIFAMPIKICDWRFSDVMCEGWPHPPVNCYASIGRLVGQQSGPSDISERPMINPDHDEGYFFWPNPTTIRFEPDFLHPPTPGSCRWLPEQEAVSC